MAVFGVDEAGKGPAIGSMFAAAVAAPTPDALPDGVADSKALSPDRREEVAASIRADGRLHVGVGEVTVGEIDDPATDMNTLTVVAHARALADVASDGDRGTVDASDVVPERFGRRVAGRVDAAIEVAARHRADETDPLVAAASVVAKVERDAHVARLAAAHGDLGSGYPGDDRTRAFLRAYVREHGSLPPCARASWRTCRDVLAAAAQSSLDGFEVSSSGRGGPSGRSR